MKYDVCIVGSGIVGLSHAYWAAKKGLKVVVIEKDATCQGASVRNFGLVWEIGQEKKYNNLVSDSKKVWNEFFKDTQQWFKPTGSLGLAYHKEELELIQEFQSLNFNSNHQLLTKTQIEKKFPYINKTNLFGALYSQNELTINSREALPAIINWLKEKYNVEFQFNTIVSNVELPIIYTNYNSINSKKIIITTGSDFELLYPKAYFQEKLIKCKLQMIKTESSPLFIEPAIYSSTSFIHYPSFSKCEKLAAVKKRIMQEKPQYIKFGINLLISQNNYNELIIGDSHEYGQTVNPFNNEEIDSLILSGVRNMIPTVDLKIKERWHGVYLKSTTKKFVITMPEKNVLIVNALAGAGMTLSFGLAKKTIKEFV